MQWHRAERVARMLWSTLDKSRREPAPATRLTQRRRREVKGGLVGPSSEPSPHPERICVVCGATLATGRSYCRACSVPVAIENLATVAAAGRAAGQMTSHGPEAQARRANARRRHARAASAWQPSSLPAWLNEETYRGKIQPLLAGATNKAVASALGSSIPYATAIRAGRRVPHPRHWEALSNLVGVSD